jgi:hypothetical protein
MVDPRINRIKKNMSEKITKIGQNKLKNFNYFIILYDSRVSRIGKIFRKNGLKFSTYTRVNMVMFLSLKTNLF